MNVHECWKGVDPETRNNRLDFGVIKIRVEELLPVASITGRGEGFVNVMYSLVRSIYAL